MSTADIVIVVIVTIFMFAIIFFSFVYPRFIKHKSSCDSCPTGRLQKIKRAFKDYHKKNR
ncbi:MAG: hypothetical protein MJ208_03220 [Bacilli bacterium]|nr:hypothetical protein [Bacilli bacterium]